MAQENLNTQPDEDNLVTTLLDFYRRVENHANFQEASRLALIYLGRLTHKDPQILARRLEFFASRLKNNITPEKIRFFAHECIKSAMQISFLEGPKSNSPSKNLAKYALNSVGSSIARGLSPDEAVKRASRVLIFSQKKSEHKQKLANIIETHPLRDQLQSLQNSTKPVAHEDVRNKLLFLKRNSRDGSLFNLLEKTASFSAKNLHKLLGDELYFYCKPLGFQDKLGALLIIEVPTSNHLYNLTYYKPQILSKLKLDRTFKNTNNIRFVVRGL